VFFDSIINPEGSIFIEYIKEIIQFIPIWASILSLWLIIQVIADIVDWVVDQKSRRIGTLIATDYPSNAVDKMLKLPISFFKEHKSGSTWDKVNRGGDAVTNIIEQIIINLSPQLLSVLIGLTVAILINPILALIITIGVLIYILTLIKIVSPIADLIKKGRRSWNKAFGYGYDSIANFQTVKSFTAEKYESKRTSKAFIDGAFKNWFIVEKIWANISFFQRITILITRLAVFIVSVFLIQKGEISIGSLIALNGYASMVFGPFVRLGHQWQIIQNGLVAIEKAEEILESPKENEDKENKAYLENIKGQVEFKNVSFSYDKKDGKVLKNINFKINPGEIVAFVGESGVGKSTTIDLISGYYFASQGSVLVDDNNVKDINLESLRKKIAIVPQEVVLFNDTIEMNIKYGSQRASKAEILEASRRAHADSFIDKFPKKYKQIVGERGIKLSVGQKQRIAIARAILRDPSILILDEPTSALDPKTENLITESLQNLMQGRTTFIIAHRLSTIRHANKIFVFDKGRIIEEGTHSQLLKINNGTYKKLHDFHIGLK